jgi:hypothetical protein
MNLHTIAGHSFDLDRLPEKPFVLDVGCRGFDFTKGIRQLRPEAYIWAMDPDPIIEKPDEALCAYLRLALVAPGQPRRQRYASGSTGEGNFLTEMQSHPDWTIGEVDCASIITISALLPAVFDETQHPGQQKLGRKWDLIKLDCEGSEFSILNNWPGPIAHQISVEFHDYNCRSKYPDSYYEGLFARLATFGYAVVRHELSDINGRGNIGHWDTILELR